MIYIMKSLQVLPHSPQQIPNVPFVIFNPFGSLHYRCLHPTQINAITEYLTQLGYQVVLIGTDAQRAAIHHEKLLNFPTPNLLDLIPLLQQCTVLVSVDTGIVYMAAAFEINTIAFYVDMPKSFVANTPKKQAELKFLQKHQPEVAVFMTHWINHQYCAPLNPNAVQILFHVEESIHEINIIPLLENIKTALKTLRLTQ